ncbi:O-antigen ligase family protein [Maribellus sp. CM-23]|uniref:O-antigen ligase family protein n=1 Tax=Maribellus sp. CM-23 TaxID=2781026 RepID=UPI001F461178|nr:O-antigen ligase family protein [Maribellus sp. CM-23]MCE4564835.1 O-antigen ligase family protein [Maribellus sp. CM-23]
MKKFLTELIDSNWFFVSLIAFVVALPLSQALVSVFSGVMLLVALLEDSFSNKINRLSERKILLLIPLIFIMYLVSTFVTRDTSFYDVQKTLFYLVIPLAFVLGKELNSKQVRYVFYTFTCSVLLAIIIALIQWPFMKNTGGFAIHKISLISHIRFSFQLVLLAWFFVFLLLKNFISIDLNKRVLIGSPIAVLLGYLFLQQSLTGILALSASIIYFIFYLLIHVNKKWRLVGTVVLMLAVLFPVLYVVNAVHSFYDIDQIEVDSLDRVTAQGNPYKHYPADPMVENGHYVNLYLCPAEMREEWNKISAIKYDSLGANGYAISSTLIRYLTSKDLRKDAEGVKALTEQDVRNVESGMANYIFERRFTLYPRIYQTIWEYYVFSHTGNSNHQSFSQRIEFARAAITIIKKNFFFGVGTGNWKQEFADAFKENNSKLSESLYASAHNQYLNYMVKFGVLGFIFIMFAMIYPIVKTKSYRDPYFLIFLVFMFVANFADSNLEAHMGSSFFFFFYSLFILVPKDYLLLDFSVNPKPV